MSNGVITLKRAFHHFHSVPEPLCEHQCGTEDDVSHRVLECHALKGFVETVGWIEMSWLFFAKEAEPPLRVAFGSSPC